MVFENLLNTFAYSDFREKFVRFTNSVSKPMETLKMSVSRIFIGNCYPQIYLINFRTPYSNGPSFVISNRASFLNDISEIHVMVYCGLAIIWEFLKIIIFEKCRLLPKKETKTCIPCPVTFELTPEIYHRELLDISYLLSIVYAWMDGMLCSSHVMNTLRDTECFCPQTNKTPDL